MLGWINKKIGTQGGGGNGDGGSSASRGAATPAGDAQHHDQHQQRGVPNPTRSGTHRRGSFLDAVGGAMGRTSRKKDDKSEADARTEQLNAQRAEKISCVAFKLVREIQRILKEARETQVVTAGVVRTPAATPPPPARGGVGTATAAAAAAPEAGAKRNRWAGTEELVALLDGGSPGGSGEVEDKVERFGSMEEVQAKMSDLVEQALVPESHGDLCGVLLEAASGDGHHPAFVKLCVDAGLPSNLVHCLRIMRVVEFESAMHDSDNSLRGTAFAAGEDGGDNPFADRVGEARDASTTPRLSGSVEGTTKAGLVATSVNKSATAMPSTEAARENLGRPLTERATERIGRLLVTLCRDKSAGVGEQIKPHLPGLLSLAVSAYPPNGAHVQETARAVVEALMGGCLSSSMVWLLHYNKVGYRFDCTKAISCAQRHSHWFAGRRNLSVFVTLCGHQFVGMPKYADGLFTRPLVRF